MLARLFHRPRKVTPTVRSGEPAATGLPPVRPAIFTGSAGL